MATSRLPVNVQAVPKEVTYAVVLSAASALLAVLDFLFQRTGISSVESQALSSPAAVWVGLALTAVFLFLIMKRKNWARIVFVVLTVLGIPFAFPVVLAELKVDPVGGILSVVQLVLQIIATVLFFMPASNAWFRPPMPTSAAGRAGSK